LNKLNPIRRDKTSHWVKVALKSFSEVRNLCSLRQEIINHSGSPQYTAKAAKCDHISEPHLLRFTIYKQTVIVIIWLLLSLLVWPKVITFSGFYSPSILFPVKMVHFAWYQSYKIKIASFKHTYPFYGDV
jgi:hypothetical protein